MSLKTVLNKYPKQEDSLIELLLEYQDEKEDNYISEAEMAAIAAYLGVSESKVCAVMTYYTLLSMKPRGKYVVQVCNNVSCFVNDDFNVLRTIEKKLRIKVNETTKDKKFSLEFTSCIGCCDQAPAIRIGKTVHTNLTKEKIDNIFTEMGCE